MPFKANADRRHHIPKQRHPATNSAAYDAALRQRGSLTVWFTEGAIAAGKAEPRTTRGGHPALAILPGALIFVTVAAINSLGDRLQAALDPRSNGRNR